MLVSELIDRLKDLPADSEVVIKELDMIYSKIHHADEANAVRFNSLQYYRLEGDGIDFPGMTNIVILS